MEKAIITAINKTLCDRDTFLEQLKQNIEKVIKEGKNQPIAEIDKRLIYLQEELLKRTNARADFEDIAQEIHALREQKQKLLMESANRSDSKQRIADMEAFLNEHPSAITEYDDSLVRRLIEKVTVYENKFVVEFKSGVMVDVDK